MSRLGSTVLAIATAVSLGACGLDRPEVARVGESDVSVATLGRAVSLRRALGDLQGATCGQPTAGESEDSACHRTVLSGEILWLAVAGYADEHALGPTDREVDELVGSFEAQVGTEALDEALDSRSVGREDLRRLGRRILTIRAVRTAVAEEGVGDAELRRLYDERIRDYTFLEANHILVETAAEARDVYRRVRDASEEEFMTVARRESIEPGADGTGGGLSRTAASGFVEPFAEAAIALEPGDVSEPVRTQFGWHVIYLVDEEVTPFAEAKAELIEPVADREFQAWLQERAADLGVEVNPRYGRFEADTFSVVAVRSTDPEGDAASSAP